MGENGRLHLFIPPRIVAIQHEPDRAGAFRFNLEEPVKHSLWIALVVILVALMLAPRGHGPGLCRDCGWVSIAAVGEPPTIMPALVQETVGRDISDQIYEKLANLSPGKPPIASSAYVPARRGHVSGANSSVRDSPGASWNVGPS